MLEQDGYAKQKLYRRNFIRRYDLNVLKCVNHVNFFHEGVILVAIKQLIFIRQLTKLFSAQNFFRRATQTQP